MEKRSTKRIALLVATLSAMGILASPGVVAHAFANDEASEVRILPGDSSVPFWPHETGALMGTSETFVDMRADGSYYDPSVGRRVFVASK